MHISGLFSIPLCNLAYCLSLSPLGGIRYRDWVFIGGLGLLLILVVTGRRMEQKQIGWYSRFRYIVSAIVFVDLPLWFFFRRHDWVFAGVCLFVMIVITDRRMGEIGWDKMWVVPYCCVTLSPFLLLNAWPNLNPWVAFSLVATLHSPVMVWPVAKREAVHIERTDSFTARAGLGRYLMQLVIFSAAVSAITLWVAPGDPGYRHRELAFVIGALILLGLAVWYKPRWR